MFLTGDAIARTIKAAYRVNSDTIAPTSLSQQFTPDMAASFLADEAIARAGILASTGNAPDTIVTFDITIKAASSTPFFWNKCRSIATRTFGRPPSAVVNDKLYVFGGLYADRNTATAEHLALSLQGGTNWTTAAPLPDPRSHLD